MDALDNYGPKTTVAAFVVNSANVTTGVFSSLLLPLGTSPIYTPQVGVTTIRMAACAVELADYTNGFVRVRVGGLPVSSTAVAQQVTDDGDVTLGYIPIDFRETGFEDVAAVAQPTAQPVVQLYGGVQLLQLRVGVEFVPLRPEDPVQDVTSVNMLLVMETDGSRSGNTAMFT